MRLVNQTRAPIEAACQRWASLPTTSPPSGPSGGTVDHYEAIVPPFPGQDAADTFNRIRERLFTYDIFSPRLVQYAICPPGHVAEGATIVQRVKFGRVALEMAVRVIAVWDRHDGTVREAGFRYATVQGHAERGIASFGVSLDAEQRVTVVIEAHSRPGTLLTRAGQPGARRFQRAITRAALRRLSA